MAKGRYAKKRAAQEARTQAQIDREYFIATLYYALKASTTYQQDATKLLSLVRKRNGGRPFSFWEEAAMMDQFREIEQGNIPEDLQKKLNTKKRR